MRAGIVVNVMSEDRRRLEAIVGDRNAPQKHVWRAKIILATADGCGTAEIMRRSGKAKPVVWRWQARFMAEGVAGLTRDKTRKLGKTTARCGHRAADAVVLSVDEKSQIQALDRTQPGLPMKPGRAGTMTHDYKRHGTTTLFAALNILDGTVIGHNMKRHRHQEFIRFLNTKGDPRHHRQLCHPQTSQGARMAGPPSPLDLPLHPDLRILAQRRRGLLRQTHAPAPDARHLPIRRRP
jgi:hypothetical protein